VTRVFDDPAASIERENAGATSPSVTASTSVPAQPRPPGADQRRLLARLDDLQLVNPGALTYSKPSSSAA
jgi:hypothetical protein